MKGFAEKAALRVGVLPSGVNVSWFDYGQHPYEGRYTNTEELPTKLQEKIAVLMVATTETNPTPEIAGVGARMDENTFWLEDIIDEHTGEEGQTESGEAS